MCRILYLNEYVIIAFKFSFILFFFIGNTKLEKWSASSLRRAGLCEDHFSEESFTNTKGLKRNAVPISYNLNVSNEDNISIPFESYINVDNNENNESNVENNEVHKNVKIEQVLHLQEAREELAQSIKKNIASTSFKYTFNGRVQQIQLLHNCWMSVC